MLTRGKLSGARVPLYPYENDAVFFYSFGHNPISKSRAATPDSGRRPGSVTPRTPRESVTPSIGRRPRSAAASYRRRLQPGDIEWNGRHHITRSTGNSLLPPSLRSYFDVKHTHEPDAGTVWGLLMASRGYLTEPSTRPGRTNDSSPQPNAAFPEEDRMVPQNENVSPPGSPSHRKSVRTSLSKEQSTYRATLQKQIGQLYVKDAEYAKQEILTPIADFYLWCIQKFKSLGRAWRHLDVDLTMSLLPKEFTASLKKHKFKGDPWYTFKLLNRDRSGVLPYYHFDPCGADALAGVVLWCNKKYGSVRNAFQALDKDRSCLLTLAELQASTKQIGLDHPRAMACVFEMIDMDQTGKITVDEIEFLDRWRCPMWFTVEADPHAAEEFKKKLLRKFGGNPIKAWNFGLDQKKSMRVSWEEFKNTCYEVHFDKNKMAPVWRHLDADLSGWLTFSEFDAYACQTLMKLKNWADENYGGFAKAFQEIDQTGHRPWDADGFWDKRDFKRVTNEVQFDEQEAELLFNGFEREGQIALKSLKYLDSWDVEAENRDNELAEILWDVLNIKS